VLVGWDFRGGGANKPIMLRRSTLSSRANLEESCFGYTALNPGSPSCKRAGSRFSVFPWSAADRLAVHCH